MTIHQIPSAAAGWQCVLDLHGCTAPEMDSVEWVREQMLEAARVAQATIVTDSFHRFEPHGISGVVVISESHIAIHTWPERRYAAIDVFTCNSRLHVDRAAEFLARVFQARDAQVSNFTRGDGSLSETIANVHPVFHAA
jgi:S-adenosylmethionine decarboxylase proenzyme